MNTRTLGAKLAAGTCLAVLSLGNGPASAADYFLRAEAATASMPGGVSVPMWAFAKCTDAAFTTCDVASVPGPALVVPPGEGLTVTVKNTLAANVSLVIAGQVTAMTPVWDNGSSGPRPSPAARVRSFTHEAAAGGGTAVYTWPSMRAGTYLYHSGTHPQVQVQMGLYGAATKDQAAGLAYTGVAYDEQVTLLYSEIDPALHAAVAGPTPTYGTASGPTSTLNYVPRYFLVNGKPYSAGDPAIATIGAGKNTLLRFINAGLKSHVPVVDGAYLRMIAEDGNAYPWGGNPRQRYSVFLPAAKTSDALLTAAPGTTRIAIYDRMLGLTNDMASGGGMLALLDVSDVGSPPSITSTPATTATQGQAYSYQVVASDPDGGVLAYALDVKPTGMSINASTGLVAWTPSVAQVGANAVTVRVTDPTARSATQPYTITVAADPATHAPTFTSTPNTSATYNVAYSYQASASDVDGGTLTYSLDAKPTGMTINAATGLIAWTPTKAQAQAGTAGVTVRVTDPSTLFATQSYTIAVANPNAVPVAVNDTYNMVQGGSLIVAARGVLGNDTDSDPGETAMLTAVQLTSPTGGGLTLNSNGGFTYTPPATIPASGSSATRSFTYQARDPSLASSNVATVTITIAANRAPTTVGDTYTVAHRTAAPYTPVVLNVLANDSDPDTALDSPGCDTPAYPVPPYARCNVIDVATVVIGTVPNKGGTATVNATGTISYTPAQGFRGTENFTYRVRDTRGALSSAATVRVNVQ